MLQPVGNLQNRFFDYTGEVEREAGAELAYLADRSAADWEAITERAETRLFHPGETIVAAGEQDQALYLLVEGLVGAVLPGAEQPFKEFDAPTVLGEVAFFDRGPRSATLVALTDCELLRLSMQAFEVLAAHHPDLGRAILVDLGRILARRLRHATDLLGHGPA